MPVIDEREIPLASIRLFAKGQGDPIVTDRGLAWYDILYYTHHFGTISLTSAGQRKLEYLSDAATGRAIGLVCKPELRFQDTRLSHYSVSPSSDAWEERRPASGAPLKYRLAQVDTTAGVQWYATSTFDLPANPEVAFTLGFMDVPPDWDTATYEPYVRIEFGTKSGAAEWGLYFSKLYGSFLVRKVSGSWEPVMELPEPVTSGTVDNEEVVIYLRCLRGQIGVSLDRGKSYRFYQLPSGAALSVAAAPVTVRGQGGQVVFGLHQLFMQSGTYTSPERSAFAVRAAATPTITGRYSQPTGTTVSFSDQSTPLQGKAKWRATLTPDDTAATPFTFYNSPELYAVLFRYPIVTALWSGLQFSSTPWDDEIYEIDIDKPLELDGATASVRIRRDAGVQFEWASGRWPKIAIILGHKLASGGEEGVVAFVGYIRPIRARHKGYNEADLAFVADNQSIRFKRTTWTDLDRFPFAGMTVNQALDEVLASEGIPLNLSWRQWHALGDRVTIPQGSPENPSEWPPRGEIKWVTMQRLAGYAGLEVVPLDDGSYTTLPYGYVSPDLKRVHQMVPDEELVALVEEVELEMDSSEGATAVLVQGVSASGELAMGYAVNTNAETNTAAADFCPWREYLQEELPGTYTPEFLALRAAFLAGEVFPLKFSAPVTHPVNLDVSRRDQVAFEGTTVGIADFDRFAVLTLHHHYEFDPSFGKLKTTAGLRRLN